MTLMERYGRLDHVRSKSFSPSNHKRSLGLIWKVDVAALMRLHL